MTAPNLLPLFDNLNHLHKNAENVILPQPDFKKDFERAMDFLKSYTGSVGTFDSYRREIERLLQWSWHVRKVTLASLKREDLESFILFCQNPPLQWIGLKRVPRYLENEGKRQPNPEWRPFVATISKVSTKMGLKPSIEQFSLSQGAVQEIFAILSTFFNFLVTEEYLLVNPVALIRQKSKFIRKRQQKTPVRRLSLIQWKAVLHAAELMATDNPEKHERTLFMLSALFGMYLRISELVASDRWVPTMNDFARDNNGHWWFTTVGKGNKERQIAVSDSMLNSLIRWRKFLGLTPLPSLADNSPLIPKIRGKGPLAHTSPVRCLVQDCFDLAVIHLRRDNQVEEANSLCEATVHWLRHTGISEDVKIRPREHVRDDAGHSSGATTDRYIDVEMKARNESAKDKKMIPQE